MQIAPTPRRSVDRMVWADAAKGLCIMLVVLHHVTGKHYLAALPDDLHWLAGPWLWFTTALKPLRMPLFFVLSGLFAASALDRPWRAVGGPRVVTPYYLYVLWLVIHAVIFSYETTLPMNRTRDLGELGLDLVYASTGLWYLYALAVYFLVLKLLRPLPPAVVVAVAVLVAVVGWALPISEVNRAAVLHSFVFFAVGALFPAAVRRIAEHRRRHLTLGLALAFTALVTGLMALGWSTGLLSVLAVPLGIRMVVAATTWPRVGGFLAYVGRRTLPVYVLHVPLLAVVHTLPALLPDAGSDAVPGMLTDVLTGSLAAVYPALVAAALVGTSLVAVQVLDALGLGWLFRRPGSTARVREHRDHVVVGRRSQVVAAEHAFHTQVGGGGVSPELFERVVAAVRGPLARVESDQHSPTRREQVSQRA